MAIERILVTGATGFLGWNVLRALSARYRVLGGWFSRRYRQPGVRMIQLDVTDPVGVLSVLDRDRPDAVFHLAAMTNVDTGEDAEDLLAEVNVDGTGHIADACAKRGIRLIFTSTDLVYGNGAGPHAEDEPPAPRSAYAASKVRAERRVAESGADHVVCRTALLYGPAGPHSRSFADWLHEGFAEGRTVPLYRDQYRSFLYAEDAARALADTAERAPSGSLFNLGGPSRMSRVEFGTLFARAFGYDERLIRPISMNDDGQGHLRGPDCSLDVSKLAALTTAPPRAPAEALADWAKGGR